MNFLNALKHVLQDPHSYAAAQTQARKRIVNRLYQLTQPQKRARLQHLQAVLAASPCRCWTFDIGAAEGHTLFDARSWDLAVQAITEARATFSQADLKQLTAAMTDRQPFTQVAWRPQRASPIVELATHECFLRPIGAYFGTLPILRHVQLVYSPNNRVVGGSSQYFHLDGQDVKSLHVFIFIEDVTRDTGPLTLLDAVTSEAVCNATAYRKVGERRRLTDASVATLISTAAQPKEMVGPAGSILMFDGDRCLHFGSRRATQPRYILNMFYTSAFSFTLKTREDCGLRACARAEDPQWKRVAMGLDLP